MSSSYSGIIGGIIGLSAKKRKLRIFQRQNWSIPRLGWSIPRLGWSSIQKEQVRNRQYGKCNMCFTEPSRWRYDHNNGNKNDNDLNNCQGLCSHCYSVKTERDNLVNI